MSIGSFDDRVVLCAVAMYADHKSREETAFESLFIRTRASAGSILAQAFPLNWLVNSVVRKRPVGIRNSYSLRTVCPSCAAALDANEIYKRRIIMMIACALAIP